MKKKIIVEIGHTAETGAVGHGLKEHAVCRLLGAKLLGIFEEAGYEVRLIDTPVGMSNSQELRWAVEEANRDGGDLLISLHCDASDNAAAHGAHVCYYSTLGQRIGERIMLQGGLARLCPGRSQAVVERRGLYVLRASEMPAVLVEAGFITHAGDARLLASEAGLGQIAACVLAGVEAAEAAGLLGH